MITHSIHTMTLARLSLMFELEQPRLILKFGWLPERMIRKAYIRFINEFDKMFSGEADREFKNEVLQVRLYNKIQNILPPLYLGLLYQPTPYLEEIYMEYFGKKPETGEDLIKIQNEINRLSKRYISMFGKKGKEPEQNERGTTLEDLILGVEMIMDRPIDRKMKIYQFKKYYDKSLQIIRKRETEKITRHG